MGGEKVLSGLSGAASEAYCRVVLTGYWYEKFQGTEFLCQSVT